MFMNHFMVISVLLNYFITDCYGQESIPVTVSKLDINKLIACSSRSDCQTCIISGSHCSWCIQANYTLRNHNQPRCNTLQTLIETGCNLENIINPQNKITILKNEENSYADGSDVQIKPQAVHLTLRPNVAQTFNVHYKNAAHYPVDLYYLMDLSNTMHDDKDNLSELGNLLAKHMASISKNFRLGFGSFVDKVKTPFVFTDPQRLLKPCDQTALGYACAAPYGFYNHLSLTDNITSFTTEVKKAKISGNLDNPEGGFDALMQAIVCKKKLGWRNYSRKLILFSTDALFHYAGDGKLAGIVKPNDAKCHIDKEGFYSESGNMDYPSVSQLSQIIKENQISVIFAVTEDMVPIYEHLKELIEGSMISKLADDSSNIVELITENLEEITTVVNMKAVVPDYVKINFMSNCLGGTMENTNICKNIKPNATVTFSVSISVQSCPENITQQKGVIVIYPVGIQEKLIIDFDIICHCDCDKPEINSPLCSSQGTFACGVCNCNAERFGDHCECDAKKVNRKDYEMNCKMPDSNTICSGRGKCECGKCNCTLTTNEEYIWGDMCECDNFTCATYAGKICGGHGNCDCGDCKCHDGFTGYDCSCTTSNQTCLTSNGLVCNNQGQCICGSCICFEDNVKERYTGPKCELCTNCPSKCEEYRPYVQCKVFKTGPYTDKECMLFNLSIENIKELRDESDTKLCRFKDEDDCTVYFMYNISTPLQVDVQIEKSCPKSVSLMIILGVIGSIVAVSLIALLIWKLLTVIQDKIEFTKFENERKNAKWDKAENPIYRQPLTTFKNPTYVSKLKET